jgi:Type III flagellar switch regulator (C-ring) FliN C-term
MMCVERAEPVDLIVATGVSGGGECVGRLAGRVSALVAGSLAGNIDVMPPEPCQSETLFADRPDAGVLTFGAPPCVAYLAVDRSLLAARVDLDFGGDGRAKPGTGTPSATELRVLDRQCVAIASCFADAGFDLPLAGKAMPVAKLLPGAGSYRVVVVSVAAGTGSAQIILAVSDAAIDHATSAASDPDGVEQWRARLRAAVLETRLTVRSIVARPEISATRLLRLRAGDVIPVVLPDRVPLTVHGIRIGEGTIGEASGRTAIRIEKLGGETPAHV